MERSPVSITHRNKVIFIGSCFTKHLGKFFEEHWFDVVVNPFGTLFNPFSVSSLLIRTIEKNLFEEEDLFYHENLWKSIYLPSKFNHPKKNIYLKQANQRLLEFRDFLFHSDRIFLTLGTAQVYIHKEYDQIVSNCHKLPSRLCQYKLPDSDEITMVLADLIRKLQNFGKEKQIIFTVSPVRYLQKGFIENTMSKARLLESVYQIVHQFERVYYFPSFEIFMDDLRDYRFYASDLIHPGEQGINYTLEKFKEIFFEDETIRLIEKIESIRKRINHRSIIPDKNQQTKMKTELEKQLSGLKKKYPSIKIPENITQIFKSTNDNS